ncbi:MULTISPECIES: DJ-1/PfpI/YhbO family deglycase/protease [Aliiglaciecola]|uniref:DJ-1/PfpI/YhbO family deglycase/protease n=1 Tax=Aliiglaciecola TaxID=1406885 RepID=UPI001C09D5E8|nr:MULTISPECIES: type 1 glutamine amidotransferase domain-containing protein [Aliiglaciecola]MBU2880132.1 type 1 glutamine amidotransferase [Aliiglaciecola lipolytica]MDO6710872.1 type 1 glutamine amidotransferase domain-containing protein [Aliiglaciecola sp. 2_MG-2023]MDO6752353.1 type 1 glutamine amidotransferase domain-containing protein [Aliiglaciecola sp. 1_MG-2023]
MSNNTMLNTKTLAIIATDGFEQSELLDPKNELEARGAITHVISINGNQTIRGWNEKDWGETIKVDKQIEQANLEDYDAVIIPGGQINPDILRTDAKVVDFIKSANDEIQIKAIAAICHGPWLLAEADIIKGKKVTSYPSIKTDLKNAQANWQDGKVVVDGKLITSRNPNDIPAFIEAITEQLVS